jgi:hypothetical protein
MIVALPGRGLVASAVMASEQVAALPAAPRLGDEHLGSCAASAFATKPAKRSPRRSAPSASPSPWFAAGGRVAGRRSCR